MNEIIDVDYRAISELEEETTEKLTIEANQMWAQMEIIGAMGIKLAAQVGQRLNVLKTRTAHGEWESWCESNLNFSTRKAQSMMKLAEKMNDENSLFAKNENVFVFGISKVYELLSAPEEVAEKVLSDEKNADLNVKELKAEIKRLKDEAENNKAQEELERMQTELEKVKGEAGELKSRELELMDKIAEMENNQQPANEDLERDLEDARRKLQTYAEQIKATKREIDDKVQKAKEKAEKEKTEQIAKARKEEEAKSEKQSQTLKEELKKAHEEIEKLQRNAAQSGNEAVAIYKVKVAQLQEDFTSCMKSIDEVQGEQGDKMKAALKHVMKALQERLG